MTRLLRAVAAVSAAVALLALLMLLVDLGLFGGDVTPDVVAGTWQFPVAVPVAFVAAVVHGLSSQAYQRREDEAR